MAAFSGARGEASEALSRLREGEQLLERQTVRGIVLHHGWVAHSLGRASLLLGRLDEARGKLFRRTGQRDQAEEHLTTAATRYRDMDMRFWLARAEAELTQTRA